MTLTWSHKNLLEASIVDSINNLPETNFNFQL